VRMLPAKRDEHIARLDMPRVVTDAGDRTRQIGTGDRRGQAILAKRVHNVGQRHGCDAFARVCAEDRSSTSRHTAPGSIGAPAAGCWETTKPSPDTRAVRPSFMSARIASRALSP